MDAQSGLVHTVGVTAANTADVSALPCLIREEDRAVFGDKGYINNPLKRHARKAALSRFGRAGLATGVVAESLLQGVGGGLGERAAQIVSGTPYSRGDVGM